MRFIDVGASVPTAAWLEKARRLSDELDAAHTRVERNDIIDRNGDLWAELKSWLLAFSSGKCWFSEARDYFSYWDVEHYRPKKIAKDLDGNVREGYWWLAFDWKNFRVCGQVGNRKKGGFFPLRRGTHQATATDRNIDDEFPYLLDPTRPEDPILLSFDENGDIKPIPALDAWNTTRVNESIKRYKLREHEPLMEGRRDIWSKCTREVNKCQNLLDENSVLPSATKKEQIREQMLKLREMVMFEAEFSATASECLRSRPEPWAQRIASAA